MTVEGTNVIDTIGLSARQQASQERIHLAGLTETPRRATSEMPIQSRQVEFDLLFVRFSAKTIPLTHAALGNGRIILPKSRLRCSATG